MENQVETRGSLRSMLVAARFVDDGLVDLEKMFMSIEGLMPDEDNKEEALEIAQAIFNEVKEIEESVEELKKVYKHLFEATKEENEKADIAIKSMQDGLDQIEETLKNYGYDSSNLPEDVPENMDEDGSFSEKSDSSLEEVNDGMQIQLVPSTPDEEIDVSSESLAGVEITPMVLKQKSRKNSHERVLSDGATPIVGADENQAPVKILGQLSVSPSQNVILGKTHESSSKSKKVLEKPVRPVLSLNY